MHVATLEGVYLRSHPESIEDERTKQNLNFIVFDFKMSVFVPEINALVSFDQIKGDKSNHSFWVSTDDANGTSILGSLPVGKPARITCTVSSRFRNGKSSVKLTALKAAAM
jgi:hypothetical protein